MGNPSEESSDYADVESYNAKDPFLFVDIIAAMEDGVSWRYGYDEIAFKTGVSHPDEIIDDHVQELEDSTSNHFSEYRIEVGDDSTVLLEKKYQRKSSNNSIYNPGNDEFMFRVIGDMSDEKLEEIWSRISRL